MARNIELVLMIDIMNRKLSGKYELNYNGIYLNLKKNNKEHCLYISSNEHDVFDYLIVIDSFIDGLHDLKERGE